MGIGGAGNISAFVYYRLMEPTSDSDLSRAKEFTDEANVFMKQFMEESDRGAALVGAAYLDELLTQLFKAKMLLTDKLSKELFQGFGPFNSVSAKIKTAYCLGWIGSETFHDFNLVRTIRNKFAHAHAPVTFADASIRALCSELKIPKSDPTWIFKSRDQFLITVSILSLCLEGHRRYAQAPAPGYDPPVIRRSPPQSESN